MAEIAIPANGIYWLRKADYTDVAKIEAPYLTGLQLHGRIEGFIDAGWEFIPVSPSDAEQLSELRKVTQDAHDWIAIQAETWTCQHADEPTRCSRCSLRQKAQSLATQLRAALNPSHLQKETQ